MLKVPLLFCPLFCVAFASAHAQNIVELPHTQFSFAQNSSISSKHSVRHWKSLRDDSVVKQDKDFSCGAAALATLLNGFYGQTLSEETILKALDKGDNSASFDDMAKALPQFGFRAAGYAANYEQLIQLKRPVVVYLKHEKNDHFSVIRGIDLHSVWLADSSLGNRRYSKQQFLNMWDTRGDAVLKGKFLAVFPNVNVADKKNDHFFKRTVALTAPFSMQTLEMTQR